MLKIKNILVILIVVFIYGFSFGQGCSDAGACSIGSLDHQEGEKEMPKIKLSYEQSFGSGEKFIFISQTSLTLEHRIFKNTSYIVRVPFIFTSGNLGNATGVGDVMISVVQQVMQTNRSQLGFMVGTKLKTNKSDYSFAGNPLPMAYQTSLGTYDIIGGIQYIWKTWNFYLAYQHPFGRNNNQYLNDPSITDPKKIYYESAQLKRGDDMALRLQKDFGLKKQQTLQTGIMAIYRIQKSEIIKNDKNVVLDGTSGITLNLYVTYAKRLKGNGIFYLTAAAPVIDRAYRADGLTRNFVLTIRFTQMW
ncbi:MAG: hypothetical protein GXO86_14125 [Chlorobi bacterium]|nr:hypothetical protein [Chlorobiota bacterium]